MASGKARALVSIARLLVSLAFGYGIYYFWASWRASDPEYYPIAAGLIGAGMLYFMLTQLKGGGE
ncbi:MAG: hypothetical protein M1530_00875 [Candidatus Marsarchaeota archaeon]|nr:hypothetical protein [Candidatus Marsarchaeota archaeon]